MLIMVPGKALRFYLQNMITLHYPHIVQLYKVPEKQVEASKTCASYLVPKGRLLNLLQTKATSIYHLNFSSHS